MSIDLPPPTPTPPSIEVAVREHLDIIQAVEKLQNAVARIEAEQKRVTNDATKDRLLLGRVERKLDRLLLHLGVRDA